MSTRSKKLITLKSSDNKTFQVDEAVALESQTIKQMIEDDCANDSIPLPNVTSKILEKVIAYCKKHIDSKKGKDLKEWDAEFVKVDHATLLNLILAADYLNLKNLLDLTCQTLADMMKEKAPEEICKTICGFTPEEELDMVKGKTPQEIRKMIFGFTPEEEEQEEEEEEEE